MKIFTNFILFFRNPIPPFPNPFPKFPFPWFPRFYFPKWPFPRFKWRPFPLCWIFPCLCPEPNTWLHLDCYTKEKEEWIKRSKGLGTGGINYKSVGDFSANSPGEWDFTVARKNEWMANPSSNRVKFFPSITSGLTSSNTNDRDNNPLNYDQHHVAFYYLITKDAVVGATLKAELLWHVRESSWDYGNTTRFAYLLLDGAGAWRPCLFWSSWLMVYDYTYSLYSSSEHQEIDEHFFKLAFWAQDRSVDREIESNFVDRYNGYYILNSSGNTKESTNIGIAYHGGPQTNEFMNRWQNRRNVIATTHGTIAVFFKKKGYTITPANVGMANALAITNQIEIFLSRANLWIEEYLKFGVFPDNTSHESKRGLDSLDGKKTEDAVKYPMAALVQMLRFSLYAKRAGYDQRLDYSTSEGRGSTVGGTKSLLGMAKLLCSQVRHTKVRFATTNAAQLTEPYLINFYDDFEKLNKFIDISLAPANMYWKDTYIQETYERAFTGALPWTNGMAFDSSGIGSYLASEGNHGIEPNTLFRYGRMMTHPANPL